MSKKRKQAKRHVPRSKVKIVKAGHGAIAGNIGYSPAGQAGFAGLATHAARKPKLRDIPLIITAKAIRKIQYWLELANGEFAGFGICGKITEPLRITDFVLLDQRTGGTHADLDDLAIGLYYNDMAENGLEPVQYGRIWFHTHPFGFTQPNPSPGDDSTFERAFGDCDWSVMLVFSDNALMPYAEIQAPARTRMLQRKIMNTFELDIVIEPNVTKAEAAKWGAEFDSHVKTAPRIAKGGKVKAAVVNKGGAIILPPLNEGETEYLDELQVDMAEARENLGLTIAEQEYERTVQRISGGIHII